MPIGPITMASGQALSSKPFDFQFAISWLKVFQDWSKATTKDVWSSN